MTQQPLFDINRSLKNCRWYLKPHNHDQLLEAQKQGLSEPAAHVLSNRALLELTGFLAPTLKHHLTDPSYLKDMDVGVARLCQAIKNNETIALFGDYDVDGATSTALMARFLRFVGTEPLIHIPDRQKEGYGPNIGAFQSFKDQGVSLIITLDCGATAHESLAFARDNDMDVIVIDHHITTHDLPPAVAVINPNRADESSPYTYLAAVGVAFMVLVALKRALHAQCPKKVQDINLINFLDIVALGTVCDVVPLVGLNRAFVTQGIKIANGAGAKSSNLGMQALKDMAGIDGPLQTSHFGFALGPRINAGGRIGEASLGMQLLTSDDVTETKGIAAILHETNAERKAIEHIVCEKAMEQAVRFAQDPVIIVSGDGWHPGVIGIVAGRLKEQFHKPALVISVANGVGKGSGRSIDGVDLGALILEAKEAGLLVNGGGHKMAAGLTVALSKLPKLRDFFIERFKTIEVPAPTLWVDRSLSFHEVNTRLYKDLQSLEPFGTQNPEPVFAIHGAILVSIKEIGAGGLKCVFKKNGISKTYLTAVMFRVQGTAFGAELQLSVGRNFAIAGTLSYNTYTHGVDLMLKDVAYINE
jgi:single-stranded-DNA-specific exonuclease